MDRKDRPLPTLFDPPHFFEPEDDVELVRIKGVRLERMRDFGDAWPGLGLWRLLDFDKVLAKQMPSGREEVDWPIVAAILTIARGPRHL